MNTKEKKRRERRYARRIEALRRVEEGLTPLPEGAKEHMASIAAIGNRYRVEPVDNSAVSLHNMGVPA